MNTMIADSGPLVTLLDRRDQFHPLAVETAKTIKEPFHTCEAIFTETLSQLAEVKQGKQQMLALLSEPDAIALDWHWMNIEETFVVLWKSTLIHQQAWPMLALFLWQKS